LLQPTINVELAVQNPTNTTIKIKSITGSISVNDRFLANVSAFGDQTVGPNSESTLRLVARPSALGVFESVRELLNAAAGQVSVTFSGSANVDGIVVPITETRSL
jgi:LEA14-like dessication related protein